MAATRIEFENSERISYVNYATRLRGRASGDQVVRLTADTGSASYTFDLPAIGFYEVRTRLFDQSGGSAQVSVTLDGTELNSILLNRDNQNFRNANLSDRQLLTGGEVFTFNGVRVGNDQAEIDYIEFNPIATGIISFGAESFTAVENEGSVEVKLLRTNGTDGSIATTINFANGSTTIPFQTTFFDGETEKTLFIPLVNDNLFTGDQVFSLTLTSESLPELIGADNTTTLTIIDDEEEPEPPPVDPPDDDSSDDDSSDDGSSDDGSSDDGSSDDGSSDDGSSGGNGSDTGNDGSGSPSPDNPPTAEPPPPIVSDAVDENIVVIVGTVLSDLLQGNGNNNIINGLDDSDALYGQGGDDTINGDAGKDSIFGNQGNDTLNGGKSKDFINGGSGRDRIQGDQGGDLLVGGDGNDIIDGGTGSDKLLGGNGNDILVGGKGNDLIKGGKGNDVMVGGKGRDTLQGGAGKDIYVLEARNGFDAFRGFRVGEDRLGLSDGLEFSDLTITNSASGAIVEAGGAKIALIFNIRANQLTEAVFTEVSDIG
ncbi:MAG: hypothetical protein VKK04_21750 [Synechococcales bacterium]|nr:hypothetical protein [Synechococcales bacterium]